MSFRYTSVDDDPHYCPDPTAPVNRETSLADHAGVLIVLTAAVTVACGTAAWALGGVIGQGWSPWLLAAAVFGFAAIGWIAPRVAGETVAGGFGYGRLGTATVSGRELKAPEVLGAAQLWPTVAGASIGVPGGLAVAAATARNHSGVLVCAAVVTALVGVAAISVVTIRAVAGWRIALAHDLALRHLRATGTATVATVTDVEFTDEWLDSRPLFVLTAVVDGLPPLRFRYADWPFWAPVPGTVFRAFIGDGPAPAVALERRYVGGPRPADVDALRRPHAGGDAPAAGALVPAWAQAVDGGDGAPAPDLLTSPRTPADNASAASNVYGAAIAAAVLHALVGVPILLWGAWPAAPALLVAAGCWAWSALVARPAELRAGGRRALDRAAPILVGVRCAAVLDVVAVVVAVCAPRAPGTLTIALVACFVFVFFAVNVVVALAELVQFPADGSRQPIDLVQEASTTGDPEAYGAVVGIARTERPRLFPVYRTPR
ncbi:hypothetical protein [Gordonia hydrophobica]|uniref:Uncharacterized protein n=1 Tax=Gordonia hydrophobica TaxID=40516 RepID=A0ABZ2U3T8_9ACTN|nr:hypothetical protein [Gordonia hydrophobica]MBM7367875.1 hypothetical protein [Gordonia hydrophobica]